MTDFHSLLRRQIKKLIGPDTAAPADWGPLLDMVNLAYEEFDRDRKMVEHSMEISAQELLEANADIRAVLEGLVDMFLRIDEAGMILNCRSRHATPLLGLGPDAVGQYLPGVVPPDLQDTFTRLVEDARSHPSFCQMDLVHGQGENEAIYDIRCIPAHHRQINMILRDTTEAHRARRQARELENKLARSERMESLGLLAGGVAHDLNNILAPLVTYPEIILADLEGQPEVRKLVEKIHNSALRASAIIQDLLTLARRGNYQSEPIDLHRVIHEYLDSAEYDMLKRRYPHHQFTLDLAEDCPRFEASPHHMNQTLMNLVANAYEANAYEGQISLSTSVIHRETSDTSEIPAGEYLRLRIQDNGVGIAPDEIDHIFEPFFSRKKPGRSGTGLGLSVVYGTVKDAHGFIEVASQPGHGATFDLYFPVQVAATASTAPRAVGTERSNAGSQTILVVDDQNEQREMIQFILQREGYRVLCVNSGRKALEMIRSQPADLVLLDMIMEPDYDGLETFRDIRQIHPAQPCLIITGYAETDRVRQALAEGAWGLVTKPYTSRQLLAAVTRALGAGKDNVVEGHAPA